jgi:hypothetical protein
MFTRGTSPAKVRFQTVMNFPSKILIAVAAYLMNNFYIAGNVRSGTALKKRVSQGVINAMNFLANILKIFP